MATRALPSGTSLPTGSDLEEKTCWWVWNLIRGEQEDERSHVIWFEGLHELLWQDCSGHLSTSVGGDGIDKDVVLSTFECKGTRETKYTEFLKLSANILDDRQRTYSCSIVGLTEAAVDTTCTSSVDDAAIFLLHHVGVGGLSDLIGTAQVDVDNIIP